ncbi:single-stranded DNA-binding protein [Arcanobacterium pinnipediorum]|uniref:Single-stranded DNA-binding protein n=1 Tax=Arcanobacterium pinnipediorum TaxID=1503041 RepID=A0ABY5AI87_9ACTO|nr:single-stranded DNA-binding protein [Arcanobacterium pinnipediorum]USR79807.1 single-stranded DNA-binding protein [Arcanobacterium pinnipediorum]
MSNETYVTIKGYAGGNPTVFTNSTDRDTGEVFETKTTVIRVGVTSRYYSRAEQEYKDGPTAWYSVRTYGALAGNVALSVTKGSPVIVRGRLVVRHYEDKTGALRSENIIIADSCGIELSTGSAVFQKTSAVPLQPVAGEPQLSHGPVNDEIDEQFNDSQIVTEESHDPAGVLDKVMS